MSPPITACKVCVLLFANYCTSPARVCASNVCYSILYLVSMTACWNTPTKVGGGSVCVLTLSTVFAPKLLDSLACYPH